MFNEFQNWMNVLLLVWAANNWPLQYYELQIRRQIELLSSRFHETSNTKKLDTRNCFWFRCWFFIDIWHRFNIFNCRNQQKSYCGFGLGNLCCTGFFLQDIRQKYPELQISQPIEQISQKLRNFDWNSHISQKRSFSEIAFMKRLFLTTQRLGSMCHFLPVCVCLFEHVFVSFLMF